MTFNWNEVQKPLNHVAIWQTIPNSYCQLVDMGYVWRRIYANSEVFCLFYFGYNFMMDRTAFAKMLMHSSHTVADRYDTFPFPGLPYFCKCSFRKGSNFDTYFAPTLLFQQQFLSYYHLTFLGLLILLFEQYHKCRSSTDSKWAPFICLEWKNRVIGLLNLP